MNFCITIKTLNERGKKKKMHNAKLECHLAGSHALRHMVSAFIYILATNLCVACDYNFYGGFIKFFFLQFKLI